MSVSVSLHCGNGTEPGRVKSRASGSSIQAKARNIWMRIRRKDESLSMLTFGNWLGRTVLDKQQTILKKIHCLGRRLRTFEHP